MVELSERTKREMAVGRVTANARIFEYAYERYNLRCEIDYMTLEVRVHVPTPSGEIVIIDDSIDYFPTEALKTKLMLVLE
jgi:hypothetical protein